MAASSKAIPFFISNPPLPSTDVHVTGTVRSKGTTRHYERPVDPPESHRRQDRCAINPVDQTTEPVLR